MGWFNLLADQGKLKSLLQHRNSKASILYNGLKTISLTSGAGKSGQPLVKE